MHLPIYLPLAVPCLRKLTLGIPDRNSTMCAALAVMCLLDSREGGCFSSFLFLLFGFIPIRRSLWN